MNVTFTPECRKIAAKDEVEYLSGAMHCANATAVTRPKRNTILTKLLLQLPYRARGS